MASIDKKDLKEIKFLAKPPQKVKVTCQLGYLLVSPEVSIKKIDWNAIQKWLSDPNFLVKSLLEKIESGELNYSDSQLKKILELI